MLAIILLLLGQTSYVYDNNTWDQTTVIRTGRIVNVWKYNSIQMVFPREWGSYTWEIQKSCDSPVLGILDGNWDSNRWDYSRPYGQYELPGYTRDIQPTGTEDILRLYQERVLLDPWGFDESEDE